MENLPSTRENICLVLTSLVNVSNLHKIVFNLSYVAKHIRQYILVWPMSPLAFYILVSGASGRLERRKENG